MRRGTASAAPPRRRRGGRDRLDLAARHGEGVGPPRCEERRVCAAKCWRPSQRPSQCPSQRPSQRPSQPPRRRAPCIVHWHLRKCGIADIASVHAAVRLAAIGENCALHRGARRPAFAGQVRRVRKRCCAARTPSLREPYDQLVSEMDFFPGDFAVQNRLSGSTEGLPGPWWSAPPYFQTRDDHFRVRARRADGPLRVRRSDAAASRAAASGATRRASSRRLRELDHVGFVESMRCTYSTLARWVAEGGLSDARDAAVARALERRASRPDSARRTMNASARLARYYEILERPAVAAAAPPAAAARRSTWRYSRTCRARRVRSAQWCANDVYAAARALAASVPQVGSSLSELV